MLRLLTSFNHCLVFGILTLGSTRPDLTASDVHTPPPRLTIGIYNVARAPESTVKGAIRKAEYVLDGIAVRFTWLDCISQTCPTTNDRPDFLQMRIVAHALAPGEAVGMTSYSDIGASSTVFYDRALGLRTPKVRLSDILGIAIAHELVHMLLPNEPHAKFGLMKAILRAEDFRVGSGVWAGVSERLAELMYIEAVRRRSSQIVAVTSTH